MNKTLTFGLGAAAVVVLALVLGTQLLGSPGGTGAGDESSPTPTVAPTPEATPTPPADAGLPAGPFSLADSEAPEPASLPLTVTIPGPGWEGDVNGGILFREGGGEAAGAEMIVFMGTEYAVFGDPCHWESTTPEAPATTVDEIVAALAAQPGRNASAAVDITIDGYRGKAITMNIPDSADFSQCDQGEYGSWNCGDPDDPMPCGFDEPGETSVKYILDVEGTLVAWHTDYRAETPADIVAEMEELVLSARFGE